MYLNVDEVKDDMTIRNPFQFSSDIYMEQENEEDQAYFRSQGRRGR